MIPFSRIFFFSAENQPQIEERVAVLGGLRPSVPSPLGPKTLSLESHSSPQNC